LDRIRVVLSRWVTVAGAEAAGGTRDVVGAVESRRALGAPAPEEALGADDALESRGALGTRQSVWTGSEVAEEGLTCDGLARGHGQLKSLSVG